MSLMDYIKNKAKSDKKTIVLAEGNEPRTVAAAEIVKREGIADLILLGDEKIIRAAGSSRSVTRVFRVRKTRTPRT